MTAVVEGSSRLLLLLSGVACPMTAVAGFGYHGRSSSPAGEGYVVVFKTAFKLAILVIVFASFIAFAMLNTAPVEVDFSFTQVSAPLAVILSMTLAVGVLLGLTAGALITLRLRRQIAHLQRQLHRKGRQSSGSKALTTLSLSSSGSA